MCPAGLLCRLGSRLLALSVACRGGRRELSGRRRWGLCMADRSRICFVGLGFFGWTLLAAAVALLVAVLVGVRVEVRVEVRIAVLVAVLVPLLVALLLAVLTPRLNAVGTWILPSALAALRSSLPLPAVPVDSAVCQTPFAAHLECNSGIYTALRIEECGPLRGLEKRLVISAVACAIQLAFYRATHSIGKR